jgi:CHASE2 domain-containing sensor protein
VKRIIKKLINHFEGRQNKLFLIDSIGAIITAFTLFVIMRTFERYFGMPKTELTYLSLIAICFCIYSISCFLFLKKHWSTFLRIIAIANLLYCAFTIVLLFKYYSLLKTIGIIYFMSEIVIIIILSYVELKVANRKKDNKLLDN